MSVGTVRNLRHGIIKLRDGKTPTPNTVELFLDEGNLQFTIHDNIFQILDRGVIDHLAQGDQAGMDVQFGIKWQKFSNTSTGASGPPTMYDVLFKKGDASTFVSTSACGPYTIDVLFQIIDPCSAAAGRTEQLVFPNFHATQLDGAEGDEFNTIRVQGITTALHPTDTYI